jgi:hypothetical protein
MRPHMPQTVISMPFYGADSKVASHRRYGGLRFLPGTYPVKFRYRCRYLYGCGNADRCG